VGPVKKKTESKGTQNSLLKSKKVIMSKLQIDCASLRKHFEKASQLNLNNISKSKSPLVRLVNQKSSNNLTPVLN